MSSGSWISSPGETAQGWTIRGEDEIIVSSLCVPHQLPQPPTVFFAGCCADHGFDLNSPGGVGLPGGLLRMMRSEETRWHPGSLETETEGISVFEAERQFMNASQRGRA